jgi:hypothetical protein
MLSKAPVIRLLPGCCPCIGINPLPCQLGEVRASHQGNQKLVLHIEDLHCNYEVQKNILRMLGEWQKKMGVQLIGVEGSHLGINTYRLARYPDQKIRTAVADYLLQQGLIGGAEYFTAQSSSGVYLQGMENASLYQQNWEAAHAFINSTSQGLCLDLKAAAAELKVVHYSMPLLAFDRQVEAYRQGKLALEVYAGRLLRQAKKLGLETSAYPTVIQAAQQAKSIYPIWFNQNRLNEEMAALEHRVRQALYSQKPEQALDRLLGKIETIEKMLNISDSPEEMQEYFAARQAYTSQAMARELRALGGELAEGQVVELDRYVSAAEGFYRTAEARSTVLVKNLIPRMELLGQDIAVLVSGGYHTPGIQKALEATGCTYVTIQPRLKYDDLVNPYFQLLQNRKLPIQKLIEKNQTQLALPPRLAPMLNFTQPSNMAITREEMERALNEAPEFLQCCKEFEGEILPLLEAALVRLRLESKKPGNSPRQVELPNQLGVNMVITPQYWQHPDMGLPQIKIGGAHAYLVPAKDERNALRIIQKANLWPRLIYFFPAVAAWAKSFFKLNQSEYKLKIAQVSRLPLHMEMGLNIIFIINRIEMELLSLTGALDSRLAQIAAMGVSCSNLPLISYSWQIWQNIASGNWTEEDHELINQEIKQCFLEEGRNVTAKYNQAEILSQVQLAVQALQNAWEQNSSASDNTRKILSNIRPAQDISDLFGQILTLIQSENLSLMES